MVDGMVPSVTDSGWLDIGGRVAHLAADSRAAAIFGAGGGADLTNLGALSQAFSHAEAFNPADGLPAEADYDAAEAYEAAGDAYWVMREEAVSRPEHSTGLLYLCHLGCVCREALVISGPAGGQMWADDPASDAGFYPLADKDGTPLGFARWYWRWLDATEAQLPLQGQGHP